MRLILVRHGDAGAYTLPDNERNLSELGKRQAQDTAQFLQGFVIDKVIASPYNRAVQTAQRLSDLPLTLCDQITPNDDPEQGVAALLELACADSALVVCHMNIIAKMTELLCGKPQAGFELCEARILEGELGFGTMKLTQAYVPCV